MDSLVGRVVGPYLLQGVIGHGSTGDVYRGAHVDTGQQVAVKALHASITAGEEFPQRFQAQMRDVAALRHSHIVGLRDFGSADGVYFIAMEIMRDGSVGKLMRERPPGEPLPVPLATDLMCQAAEALAYAHARGIVHNDIRPSNLLLDGADEALDADEDTYTLKVSDFGLAHLAAGANAMTFSELSLGSGLMLGAPAYMSPELCRGRAVDGRSDLYALGVVLYEMLTGLLPFPAMRLEDSSRERLAAPPPLPHLINPEIPPSLEYVMMRCLAKQAADRFDTAMDLANAVRAATRAA